MIRAFSVNSNGFLTELTDEGIKRDGTINRVVKYLYRMGYYLPKIVLKIDDGPLMNYSDFKAAVQPSLREYIGRYHSQAALDEFTSIDYTSPWEHRIEIAEVELNG